MYPYKDLFFFYPLKQEIAVQSKIRNILKCCHFVHHILCNIYIQIYYGVGFMHFMYIAMYVYFLLIYV